MRAKMTKIIASLMAIVLITSVFTACGDNNNDETTTTTNSSTVQSDATTNEGENTTEPVSENASSEDASSNDTTDPSSEGTTIEGDPTTPNSTTNPVSTNSTEPTKPAKMPSTKAEIIKYYKDAAAKINSKKAGFEKRRSSVADKFEIPKAFKIIPKLEELIKGFMGMGSEAYEMKVAKGKVGALEYPDASGTKRKYYHMSDVTLSESDVEKATCVKDGANYVITLELKDGKSAAGKGVTTVNKSALDRCGICVDDKDYDFFDHKTAEIMYDAIKSTASDTQIYEETDDCKLVAKINASTGNMVNLKVVFDLECNMTINLVGKHSVEAEGTTTVEYKNFKW